MRYEWKEAAAVICVPVDKAKVIIPHDNYLIIDMTSNHMPYIEVTNTGDKAMQITTVKIFTAGKSNRKANTARKNHTVAPGATMKEEFFLALDTVDVIINDTHTIHMVR